MNKLADIIAKVWNLLVKFALPVSRLGGFLTAVFAYMSFAKDLFTELFARLDSIAIQATGNVSFAPLSLANYILPVDLIITHLSVICVLKVVCAGIRIIKSFIPTVA